MIGSVAELEEWFEFATGYADANRSNARRPFDTAARAANRAFTPEFTDAVLVLSMVNFGQLIRLIRNADSNGRARLLDELTEQYVEDNPDPDRPRENRKQRGKRNLLAFLRTERNAGRPRPSRQVIEDKIRREERISQRELDADLVDAYAELVALGLVSPRA